MSDALSVSAAMTLGRSILREAGIEAPDVDLRLLMAAALDLPPDRVLLHLREPLAADQEAVFMAHIQRRARREPVSHILGYRDFYGRRFAVSPDVLDPRPETETLIALALQQPFARLLDLGTGSGCIAITLLAECPAATGMAVDLSQAALAVAEANARAHGVADRLHLAPSDWWQSVSGQYDLVVSNPPYVTPAEYQDLAPELHFEPKMALTPGGDGLDAYRQIAGRVANHIAPGGRLLLEIGATQGQAVCDILGAAGFLEIALHPDLDGRDRVVSAGARGV